MQILGSKLNCLTQACTTETRKKVFLLEETQNAYQVTGTCVLKLELEGVSHVIIAYRLLTGGLIIDGSSCTLFMI